MKAEIKKVFQETSPGKYNLITYSMDPETGNIIDCLSCIEMDYTQPGKIIYFDGENTVIEEARR